MLSASWRVHRRGSTSGGGGLLPRPRIPSFLSAPPMRAKVGAISGDSRMSARIGFITGPSRDDVIDHMDVVDTGVMSLNQDITAWFGGKWGLDNTDPKWPKPDSPRVDEFLADHQFTTQWTNFFQDWKGFSEDFRSESWWTRTVTDSRSSQDVDNQVHGYNNQLVSWRSQAKERGVTVTGRDPVLAEKNGPTDLLNAVGKTVAAGATVLIVGAVAVGGFYLIKALGSAQSAPVSVR